MRTSPAITAGRTEVLHGSEKVMVAVLQFTKRANTRIDACVDHTRPSLAIEIERIKSSFLNASKRGVKFRYLTEITPDNIHYCKQLIEIVDELRHLDGIKGNFYISESEYIAPARLHRKGKQASQIIFSNFKEIVEHQRYVFNSFWTRARPAEDIIRELEEGVVHYETKVIDNSAEIIHEISRMTENSVELSSCLAPGGLQYSYDYFFKIKKKLIEKQKRGKHKGVRYVSILDRDNLDLAKTMMDAGIQIRYVKNLPPMSFGVSDKQIAATIEKMEGGRVVQSLLVSNEPSYIMHFRSLFEELWKNGVDGANRIKDIEAGWESQDIEIIQNPVEMQAREFELLKYAENEILIIFSTANAFRRRDRAGAMDLLNEATARGVEVKILTPMDDLIKVKADKMKQGKIGIDVRNIEEISQTKVTIYLVDRKFSLTVEVRDDTKETSYEAVGLATFSNSKATVLSYVSIFETLWMQAELYGDLGQSNEKLAAANERLEVHDKMQSEFINIAAHELRSPIQPLLGLIDVLRSKIKDPEQLGLLDVMIRNAKRLQRLAEDILDVTRIEGQALKLNKELFDLNEIIYQSIQDRKNQVQKANGNTRIIYEPGEDDITLVADKGRLTQVIANILDNALKFTKEGTVSIKAQKKNNKEVTVSIEDTGTGIDPNIFPKLFTKFAAKSEIGGTGLGMFIAKSIIEAHGGKIWAENKVGGRGARFNISLQTSNQLV